MTLYRPLNENEEPREGDVTCAPGFLKPLTAEEARGHSSNEGVVAVLRQVRITTMFEDVGPFIEIR